MPSGGKRPGAGRPRGAKNRKTVETIRAVEESGLTPLDYMLQVLRDSRFDATMRMDAAKAAAPYCHTRLHSNEVTLMQPCDRMTDEEITSKLAELLAEDSCLLAKVMQTH